MLQRVSAIAGILVILSGSIFTIDSRYAIASDVTAKISQVQMQQAQAIQSLESKFNAAAADRLKDEIFKLDFKKNETKLTSLEAAMSERYKRALKKIEAKDIQ